MEPDGAIHQISHSGVLKALVAPIKAPMATKKVVDLILLEEN
jgi:hypothetical protein